MDVTSLLNIIPVPRPAYLTDSLESTPAASTTDGSTASSTIVSTPSPPATGRPGGRIYGRTPRRRTPWDAGGYSLPLTLDAAKLSVLPAQLDSECTAGLPIATEITNFTLCSSDSRNSSPRSTSFDMPDSTGATPVMSTSPRRSSLASDAERQVPVWQRTIRDPAGNGAAAFPKSPQHKCSDSHGSFTSYASSHFTSGSHSRISSSSTTVSGAQPFTQPLNDLPSFESKWAEHQQLSPVPPGQTPGAIRTTSSRTSLPQSQIVSPAAFDDGVNNSERARSPSDAILITRPAGSNRSSPIDALSPQHMSATRETNNPSGLNPYPAQAHGHYRLHKRTVSAPDFAALSTTPANFSTLTSVPNPSTFAPPQQAYTMPSQTAESEPVTPVANMGPQNEIKCMYIDNCDTGSQPRKAISHIFGRNKLCTRMIPAHVWVHYCRKHYQRSRYRNGHEYAKLQIDLVEQQIERVQRWSDQNKATGAPRVVTGWSLAIRKREQKRLEDKQDSRKRAFYGDSDDEAADDAVASGTAVPPWLLQKCGTGYSTEEILAIVGQLKSEIHGSHLSQIPDIEILPCISSDGIEGKPKASQKRKTGGGQATGPGGAHKRSQSMGVALRPTDQRRRQPIVRRPSQPGAADWDHSSLEHPVEKRQRTSELDTSCFGDRPMQPPSVPPSVLARAPESGDNRTRRVLLAHRPAYGHDTRGQFSQEDYYYSLGSARQGLDPISPYVFRGAGGALGSSSGAPRDPLPSPDHQRRPQQQQQQPVASHFETATASSGPGYHHPLRSLPYHQRSQSDLSSVAFGLHGRYPSASSATESAPPAAYSYDTTSVGYEPSYGARQGYSRVGDAELLAAGAVSPARQPATSPHYHDPRQYHYTATPYDSSAGPPVPSRVTPLASGSHHHVRHPSSPGMARATAQAQAQAAISHGYTYSPLTSLPPRYDQSHEQQSYEPTSPHQQRHSSGVPDVSHRYMAEDESARNVRTARQ